jgi:hypothetical protein
MSILRPNIAALDAKFKNIAALPGGQEALQSYIMNLAQNPANIGSSEYILAAGHLKTLNDLGSGLKGMTPKKPPFMAELLSGVNLQPEQAPMPQQMQAPSPTQTPIQLPEQAGGVAALPTPNLDETDFAGGGIVAFGDGGDVERFQTGGSANVRPFGNTIPSMLGAFGTPERALGRPATSMLTEYGTPRSRKEVEEMIRSQNPNATAGEIQTRVAQIMSLPTTQAITPATLATTPTVSVPAIAPTATPAAASLAPAAPAAPAVPTVAAVRRVDGGGEGIASIPTVKPPAFEDPMRMAERFIPREMGPAAPEQTPMQALEEQREFYKAAGVDMDPNKARREQVEKELSGAKAERNEAGLMRLAEFGFRWASQNGPFLQAAAKAGAEVAPGLISDLKDLNKLDRDRNKELAGINALDAQAKRATADSARDALRRKIERKEDRLFETDKARAGIAANIAASTISAKTSLAAASMSAQATIAKLQESLGLTETRDIVDAAVKALSGNLAYSSGDAATKDKLLSDEINRIMKARATAQKPTVTPR